MLQADFVAVHQQDRPASNRRIALVWYLGVAILAGLGTAGKTHLLAALTHLPVWLCASVAVLSLCVPLLWPIAWPRRRVLGWIVPLVLVAIFLVIVRSNALHKLGRGSDQGDCVIVASKRMLHGAWPYAAADMPTKNAMSCGPGWVALQAPAIGAFGYAGDQILCWAIGLLVLFRCLGRDQTLGVLTLIGLSIGTWLSAADGNDFLPFGLILAALYAQLRSTRNGNTRTVRTLCAAILFFVAQFRAPTVFLPLFFRKQLGLARSMTAFLLALVCQLAFLLWNPRAFVAEGPMHVGLKLLRVNTGFNAWTATAELMIPAVLGGLAVLFLMRGVQDEAPWLLGFLALLLFVPACQNLVLLYQRKGSLLTALQFWEGGNWIEAMVPLAAIYLAEALSSLRVRNSQSSDHVASRVGFQDRFAS